MVLLKCTLLSFILVDLLLTILAFQGRIKCHSVHIQLQLQRNSKNCYCMKCINLGFTVLMILFITRVSQLITLHFQSMISFIKYSSVREMYHNTLYTPDFNTKRWQHVLDGVLNNSCMCKFFVFFSQRCRNFKRQQTCRHIADYKVLLMPFVIKKKNKIKKVAERNKCFFVLMKQLRQLWKHQQCGFIFFGDYEESTQLQRRWC